MKESRYLSALSRPCADFNPQVGHIASARLIALWFRETKSVRIVASVVLASLLIATGVSADTGQERRGRIHQELVEVFNEVDDFHTLSADTGVTSSTLVIQARNLHSWLSGEVSSFASEPASGDNEWDRLFIAVQGPLKRYAYALEMYIEAAIAQNYPSWDLAVDEMNREFLAYQRLYDDLWSRFASLEDEEMTATDWAGVAVFWGIVAAIGIGVFRWGKRRSAKKQPMSNVQPPDGFTPFPNDD